MVHILHNIHSCEGMAHRIINYIIYKAIDEESIKKTSQTQTLLTHIIKHSWWGLKKSNIDVIAVLNCSIAYFFFFLCSIQHHL